MSGRSLLGVLGVSALILSTNNSMSDQYICQKERDANPLPLNRREECPCNYQFDYAVLNKEEGYIAKRFSEFRSKFP